MRKLLYFFVALVMISCNNEKKDFISIKGKTTNESIESIAILGQNYMKKIPVINEEFSDTLQAPAGIYSLVAGGNKVMLYLNPGDDLTIDFGDEMTNKTISFTGIGAETNNFLQEKTAFAESELANPETYFSLEKEAFEARILEAKAAFNNTIIDLKKVDSTLLNLLNQRDRMFFTYLNTNYDQMHASAVLLGKGKPSPVFENYENFAGGTNSLSDYKGKFVYLDIWATWCGPCKAEIPYLKELEKEFKGKNIEFISISVDNIDGRRGSYESWKKMVEEQQLGGVQLFADNDFNSKFIRDYNINGIPRFILIDPQGNIVSADAIRPSNPSIRDYFSEIGVQ
jgi:thiol-disulfide isomerase/thioredoxin